MKLSKLLTVLSIIVFVSSCSSLKMGITKDTKELSLKEESLLLMSLDLKNENAPSYQPEARVLLLENAGESSTDQVYYDIDSEGATLSDQENKYFVRLNLKPGKYVIRGISGGSGIFPVIGTFFMPLHFFAVVAVH